jgi:hypothetical protein
MMNTAATAEGLDGIPRKCVDGIVADEGAGATWRRRSAS